MVLSFDDYWQQRLLPFHKLGFTITIMDDTDHQFVLMVNWLDNYGKPRTKEFQDKSIELVLQAGLLWLNTCGIVPRKYHKSLVKT